MTDPIIQLRQQANVRNSFGRNILVAVLCAVIIVCCSWVSYLTLAALFGGG